MDLKLNADYAIGYHSKSQVARVITERWMADNMYCPRCGNPRLGHFGNNRPVADFYCPECGSQYELKARDGGFSRKVADGGYAAMIARIESDANPDFFFMEYGFRELAVSSLTLIPKHFFHPDIIEERKPLSSSAKRAGWVGCNIVVGNLPPQGKISIISGGDVADKGDVLRRVSKSDRLRVRDMGARGWLFDVLRCVNEIQSDTFSLGDVYRYEGILGDKHPSNKNVRAKIRQQLQLLRDGGYIAFLGNGNYKKML